MYINHHASASIIFSKTTITRKKKNVQCSGKRKCSSSGTGCHTAHAGSFQNFPSSSWLLLMVLRLVSRVVCYLGFSVTRSDAVRCFSLHLFLGCFRTFESVLKTLLGTAKTIFLHVENFSHFPSFTFFEHSSMKSQCILGVGNLLAHCSSSLPRCVRCNVPVGWVL